MKARDKYDILNPEFTERFGLENVKGMTRNMTEHDRNLSTYAEELVAHYAKFDRHTKSYDISLETLSTPLQNELIRRYIESIDREIEWACYGDDQSINSDFLCSMLVMLQDENQGTRENFTEVVKKNLLSYYAKSLQRVLDEACETHLNNNMNEQGYYARQDREHSELLWEK